MSQYQRSVLVVEDEPFIRALVSDKLTNDGFRVQVASSARDARKITDFEDIVAVAMSKLHPEMALVFLTHVAEPKLFGFDTKSVPKNAAYLLKSRLSDPGVLNQAIEAALRDKVGEEFRDDLNPSHSLVNVSRTQFEVLRMIAKGYSNQQIAEERGTTLRAVENLVNRAVAAAGIDVQSKTSARVLAVREFVKAAGLPE
jgi:DNA-binding NarL/FixJ family response regulator